MPVTDPTAPMTRDAREAEHARADDPAPAHDPLAALRAAMDQLNQKVVGDLHDRLAAHDAMLRAIGNLILHPPAG